MLRLPMTAGVLAGVLLFVMPFLWVKGPEKEAQPEVLQASPQPVASEEVSPEGKRDGARTVRVLLEDGTVNEQTMAEYLWCVVAAEMPASFEEEALRAQAVCARTYTVWKTGRSAKHENADICADSSCCQAYTTREEAAERWGDQAEAYTGKIAAAVADTGGIVAVYEGEPIQAVFFSSSADATEDAAAVWGQSLPYLVSVASPEGEEVPNYHSQVVYTGEEVKALVQSVYPGAELSGEPAEWFSNVLYTASGRVASLEVGGVTLSGGAARTLFSLRSAYFRVEAGEDQVVFSVTGYGHGVGLSQYGANAMAKEGKGWEEILKHYYTGITLETLEAE